MAQWQQVGSSLSLGNVLTTIGLTALTATSVAYIDGTTDQLRTYTWDGSTWAQTGNGLGISSGDPSITALTTTSIAFIDVNNKNLRKYDWDGTNWSQVGNGLQVGPTGSNLPSIAALSSTRIAYVQPTYLRAYDWNGTDWVEVGNALSISGVSNARLAALTSTRVAMLDSGTNSLKTYDFNGTNWTQVGNSLSLSANSPGIAALTDTKVVVGSDAADEVQFYSWDGTDWSATDNSVAVSGAGSPSLAALSSTLVAYADNGTDSLRTFYQPNEMVVVLDDTTFSASGTFPAMGDMVAGLEGTTATIVAVTNLVTADMTATLGPTIFAATGYANGWVVEVELVGTQADTIAPSWAAEFSLASLVVSPVSTFYNPSVELQLDVQGVLDDLAAFVEQENLQASAESTMSGASDTTISLAGASTGTAELLYNPRPELTLSALATLKQLAAYVKVPELQAQAGITAEARSASALWLAARSSGTLGTDLQHFAELTLEAVAGAGAVEAFAAVVDEIGSAGSSIAGLYALSVIDNMAADLIEQNTLIVGVEETLAGEAGDSVQALGSYFANVKDMVGAWLVLKTSGEVVQGWVMNVEGERPISEYTNFEFNSMTRIGDRYFAASDEGLHVLGGDTDSGADIDAKVSTMMLDFDTTAQKRVVAAYLGYTSTGTVVLKVRSVDDGQLVEHWYEAQEVRADAPRAGYKPLGRGLRSRYWQFELANVDGADFELDKLELQPLKLRRRV